MTRVSHRHKGQVTSGGRRFPRFFAAAPVTFSFCFLAQALQMHLCPHASKIQLALPSRQMEQEATASSPSSPPTPLPSPSPSLAG